MAIYSQELQDLTSQLVIQTEQLQQAIASDDSAGVTAAADAIAQTAAAMDQLIKSADVPADNTMILYLTTDLLLQVDQLQHAEDKEAAASAASAIEITVHNIEQCVKTMAEWQPQEKEYPLTTIPTGPV